MSPSFARPAAAGRLSPRRVAIALAAAVVVVVAVVLVARAGAGGDEGAAGQAATTAPIEGRPPLVAEPPEEARRLTGAARAEAIAAAAAARPDDVGAQLALAAEESAADRPDAAAAALDRAAAAAPGDGRIDAARAVLAFDPARPDDTVDALRALEVDGGDAFTRMQLAVALLWAGRTGEAQTALQEIRGSAPEGFFPTAADDLLHPGRPNGYPPFLTARGAPPDLAEAQAAVAAAPRDAAALVALGAALQADGQRAAAARAYADALAISPDDVDARVGQIVNGFDKDRPDRAFGQLGPLARDRPETAVPRFHLGMLLLWLGDREQARGEFEQVASAFPEEPLGRLAQELAASSAGGAAASTGAAASG